MEQTIMHQEWLGYDPERGDIYGYTSEQMQEVLRLLEECKQDRKTLIEIFQTRYLNFDY